LSRSRRNSNRENGRPVSMHHLVSMPLDVLYEAK
jgi:hypothetical protein